MGRCNVVRPHPLLSPGDERTQRSPHACDRAVWHAAPCARCSATSYDAVHDHVCRYRSMHGRSIWRERGACGAAPESEDMHGGGKVTARPTGQTHRAPPPPGGACGPICGVMTIGLVGHRRMPGWPRVAHRGGCGRAGKEPLWHRASLGLRDHWEGVDPPDAPRSCRSDAWNGGSVGLYTGACAAGDPHTHGSDAWQ